MSERDSQNTRQANFDPVARLYRWAEYISLGPLLQRTRTHFLPRLKDARRAVLFGDGDGRFLAQLFAQNPALQAVAVDTSARMLTLLAKRCNLQRSHDTSRLRTKTADALTHVCSPDTDLVVTHFFLDCLTQPQVDQLVQRLAAQLSPGTLWLLSDFRVPAHGVLKPLARLYIRSLYLAFRILTGLRVTQLPNPQAALANAGFSRLAEHRLCGGILYTELWRLEAPAKIERTTMTDEQKSPPAQNPKDALPNPEPISPSLAEPDPGVFHHEPNGEKIK